MHFVIGVVLLLILIYYFAKEGATGGYSYGGAYSGPAAGPAAVSTSGHSSQGGYGHSSQGGYGYNMPYPSAGAYSGWYGYGLFPVGYFPRSWVGLAASRLVLPDDDAGAPYIPVDHVSICEDVDWQKPCSPLNEPGKILV